MRYFDRPAWQWPLLIGAVLLLVVLLVAIPQATRTTEDARTGLVVLCLGLVAALIADAYVALGAWDRRTLRRAMKWRRLSALSCAQRAIPAYRFVDLYQACERLRERLGGHALEATSQLPLSMVIGTPGYRKLSKPLTSKFDVGPGESQWFPDDRFWIVAAGKGARPDTIVRLHQIHDEYRGDQIVLEVASAEAAPERVIDELTAAALKHSIYRGHVVRLQTGEGLRDDIGTQVFSNELRIAFCTDKEVSDEDIILDDKIRRVLHRNVFSFHALRERLAEFGIPQRRGLLLFGPPGTGKTYACRYMYSQLDGVTALIVTGQALMRLKSVCEFARMLQPSLLVLEDVDLVFSEREINPHSTSLGDMLDELDGFESDDAITVVLTTNAIERVERAIKDRPGRIGQCVFMAPPNAALRRRYLERFLRDCDASAVEYDRVVEETRGASQAFLKEMVFRAIQVGMERSPERRGPADLQLETDDFLEAIEEMTSQTEKAAQSIIGLIG